MGLTRQLRDTLEQLIDDTIHQAKMFRVSAQSFRPLISEDVDFALGIAVGEIHGGFYNYFTVLNKRSMNDDELVEMYHVIRGRASEIRNAILAVE
ncbi:MAG: hypothetical protein ACE5KA_00725 [Nitrososphaerales archaeon]